MSSPAIKETVQADATKDFFVNMLTRDILLHDCVLDLADNSIDGANRVLATRKTTPPEATRYAEFEVKSCRNVNDSLYPGRPKIAVVGNLIRAAV
jgi:hypothetical protein